ncbi:hypothetical protein ACFVYJ_00920 [Pontibacter sp. JAM-7]|uniref:hypothetical protein n=1 Tax=Pontibacter sp. JAM-7 TaxID=3366581 RepID=UPI003AF451A2
MTRLKKSRKATGFIDDTGPSRRERLADPESYESRRRKSQETRKKHKSLYEKHREAEQAASDQDESESGPQTRLAKKIRRLNQSRSENPQD